jgi:ubiquinone biosynthesis accessory factor UbiK
MRSSAAVDGWPHLFGAGREWFCLKAGRGLTPPGARSKLVACRRTPVNLDPKMLDDLARRLSETVPPGLTALRDDLERNFRAVLQSGLARLDLVTRQEFDVQSGVLRRTRERLEQLESRLAQLESRQG